VKSQETKYRNGDASIPRSRLPLFAATLLLMTLGSVPSVAADPTDIVEGRRTFMVHCSHCHGVAGNGAYAPNLTDNETLHGDEFEDILGVVTNGVAGTPMRSWSSTFDLDRRRDVAAFVLSLRGSQMDTPQKE
jgi:cytochrome c oxidase cbb3-type subunit 3